MYGTRWGRPEDGSTVRALLFAQAAEGHFVLANAHFGAAKGLLDERTDLAVTRGEGGSWDWVDNGRVAEAVRRVHERVERDRERETALLLADARVEWSERLVERAVADAARAYRLYSR